MLAGCLGWDFAFVFIFQWPVRPATTFKPLVIFVHRSVPSISEKKRGNFHSGWCSRVSHWNYFLIVSLNSSGKTNWWSVGAAVRQFSRHVLILASSALVGHTIAGKPAEPPWLLTEESPNMVLWKHPLPFSSQPCYCRQSGRRAHGGLKMAVGLGAHGVGKSSPA